MPPSNAAPAQAQTVTQAGVELLREGTWATATAVVTFTRSDLEAMVLAAKDPEVDAAPIKFGHIDPRFNDPQTLLPLDGQPALGWVTNLSLGEKDGRAVLRGDLIEVPTMLAAVMPAAYRRRSAEVSWGVRTPSGRRYDAALSGLALLGVAPPAVKGLEDVAELYGVRKTTSKLSAESLDTVLIDLGDGSSTRTLLAARAAVEALNPDEPARVALLSAIDAVAAAGVNPDPATKGAENGNNDLHETKQEAEMAKVDEAKLREILGLEEDADVEAKVKELVAAGGASQPQPTGSASPESPPVAPSAQPPATPAPQDPEQNDAVPTDAAKPELVTLTAENYRSLLSGAQEGSAAFKKLREQEVQETLTTCLRQGRIAPTETETWKGQLERDFEGTKTLLSSLAPRFSTVEQGSELAGEVTVDAKAWDDFETSMGFVAPEL